MRIVIAQFTFATPETARLKDFFSTVLGDSATLEDHDFYCTFQDKSEGATIAVVPHNGDEMWDKPWLTLATDDFPAALEHIRKSGASDIRNSGPTDAEGNPTHCVTFRDPDGRLVMLALLAE